MARLSYLASLFRRNKTLTALILIISTVAIAQTRVPSLIVDTFAVNSGGSATFNQLTATTVPYLDGSKVLTSSAVTPTELGYVSGVTSALQTQLDAKLDDFSSTTDNALVRTNGTSGAAVQDSGITIDDTDVMSGVTQLNVDNLRLDGNTIISTDTNGNITLTPDGTGDVVINTGVSGTAILDEDDLVSDSATKLATQQSIKAYVDAATGSTLTVSDQSTTYTALTTDDVILADASGGDFDVDLYTAVGNTGRKLIIINDGSSGDVTVDPNASETIDGYSTIVLSQQYEAIKIISNGANWVIDGFMPRDRVVSYSGTNVTTFTANQFKDVTSITLTPGYWDIYVNITAENTGATTASGWSVAVSTFSGNTTTDHVDFDNTFYGYIEATGGIFKPMSFVYRATVAATDVYYIKAVKYTSTTNWEVGGYSVIAVRANQ